MSTLLLGILFVAMAVAWWVDRRKLTFEIEELRAINEKKELYSSVEKRLNELDLSDHDH